MAEFRWPEVFVGGAASAGGVVLLLRGVMRALRSDAAETARNTSVIEEAKANAAVVAQLRQQFELVVSQNTQLRKDLAEVHDVVLELKRQNAEQEMDRVRLLRDLSAERDAFARQVSELRDEISRWRDAGTGVLTKG